MSYLSDFGAMKLAHEFAELHSLIRHRADDDESIEVCRRAGELVEQAVEMLKERWEWSGQNPPAILRGDSPSWSDVDATFDRIKEAIVVERAAMDRLLDRIRALPMHTQGEALYSLHLLESALRNGAIDEETFRQARDRIETKWPALKSQ